MGYLPSTAYSGAALLSLGELKRIATVTVVEEPAGYEGEWVTPAGQGDRPPEKRLKIRREGEVVYQTHRAAMVRARKMLREYAA